MPGTRFGAGEKLDEALPLLIAFSSGWRTENVTHKCIEVLEVPEGSRAEYHGGRSVLIGKDQTSQWERPWNTHIPQQQDPGEEKPEQSWPLLWVSLSSVVSPLETPSPKEAWQGTDAQITESSVCQKTHNLSNHQFTKFTILPKQQQQQQKHKNTLLLIIYNSLVSCLQWKNFSSLRQFL